MKLWEIIRDINDGKVKKGDQFNGINSIVDLIVEYDGSNLIYNTLMGDSTTRDVVTCCSGEMNTDFEKIIKIKFRQCNEYEGNYKICPSCKNEISSKLKHAYDNEWCPNCGQNLDIVKAEIEA